MVTSQLQTRTVQFPSQQDETLVNAYFTRPTSRGFYPGIIVIMEAFGMVEHINDVARRFATEKFIALAPDMYTREGSPDPNNMDEVMQKMFSVPDSQAMADLEGAAAYLKSRPDCNGKIGVIGFCSGGRYTFMFACNSKNVDAAIDSAGGFIIQDEHTPQRPVSPIDMVPNLSCPMLGLFGEEDPNPSPAHAARIKEEMSKHGKTYEEVMYSDAGHAFFADYRPSYRKHAADDAWERMLDWFGRYLRT